MKNNLIYQTGRFFSLSAVTLLFFAGCQIEQSIEPRSIKLTDVISEVRINDTYGVFHEGEPPQSNSDSQPVLIGAHEIVKGGSLILGVQQLGSAGQLIISLKRSGPDYLTLNFGEMESGYFMVDFGDVSEPNQAAEKSNGILNRKKLKYAGCSAPEFNGYEMAGGETSMLIVSFADSTEVNNFSLGIAAMSGTSVSNYALHNASVNTQAAISNNLQVSLNWIDLVDIDLHVETPDGQDIYWERRVGQNGGNLDLDSNPGCELDYVNNENITWPTSEPANGIYSVRVDLWSACDMSSSLPFVVTARYKGNSKTFTGSFSPSEETQGTAFSGRHITKLYYHEVPGNVPAISQQPYDWGCWAACMTMLMSWNDNKTYTIKEAMNKLGNPWPQKFLLNKGLSGSETLSLLSAANLKAEPEYSPIPNGIFLLLKDHGPLIFTSVPGFNLHDRVVTGIYGDGTLDKTFVNVIDPWDGSQQPIAFQDFLNHFIKAYSPNFVQIMHY